MINSRDKGARFEREVARKFGGQRNLEQCRNGGADIITEQFAVECKNVSKMTKTMFKKFWHQAEKQAQKIGKNPLLIVRETTRRGLDTVYYLNDKTIKHQWLEDYLFEIKKELERNE